MKFELDKIESLIWLTVDSLLQKEEQSVNIDELKLTFETEIKRIEKSLIHNVLELKKDKQIQRYIHHHQSGLVKLSNTLDKYCFPKKLKTTPGKNSESIYHFFYVELDKLLSYIEKTFENYFNQDTEITYYHHVKYQMLFQKWVSKIDNTRNCELMNIGINPINIFLKQTVPVTYRKSKYLKELVKRLKNTCPKCSKKEFNCRFKNTLMYLNFNNFKFFTYLVTNITLDYQKERSINKQLNTLAYHLKKLNQTRINPYLKYQTQYPSIKEQLSAWLYEEISYLEKSQQLIPDSLNSENENLIGNFKLVTNLTVPQLAYFIRLLVDSGIISSNNNSELIKFLVSVMKTKKTENISFDSFRTKFYAIEENTKQFVREEIIKLLNATHQEI